MRAERWFHTLVVVGASLSGCGGRTQGTSSSAENGGATTSGGAGSTGAAGEGTPGSAAAAGTATPVEPVQVPRDCDYLLASSERQSLARHLPLLLDLSLSSWLAEDPDYPDDLPLGYGIVSCATIRAATLASVRDVLLPGFAHVGIDVGAAQRYLRWP